MEAGESPKLNRVDFSSGDPLLLERYLRKGVPCAAAFHEDDLILLNGDKQEVEGLRRKMDERRLKAKMEKKSKKPKAVVSVSQPDQVEDSLASSEAPDAKNNQPRDKINFVSSSKATADASSASFERATTSSSAIVKRPMPCSDEKSEAYKSIFTSHSSAKRTKDQSSNWVTHTAYYF